MKAIAILSTALILTIATAGFAGESPGYINDKQATNLNVSVKMALHILPHGVNGCGGKKALPVIANFAGIIRTQSTLTDLDAFMVLFDYDEISGYEYGLTWPADWGTASTNVCVGDLGVGQIVNPTDDGIAYTISAGGCKVSGVDPAFLPLAFHWLVPASNGEITIKQNLSTGNTSVIDCPDVGGDPVPAFVQAVYNAGVNVVPTEYFGDDVPATVPTSWGAIKALFR